MAHRSIWHAVGRDRRRILWDRKPMFIRSDFTGPATGNPDTKLIPAYEPLNGTPAGLLWLRPYCITDPPFTTDNLGQSFPAGTIWVVPTLDSQNTMSASNLRAPGTATNPLTVGRGTPPAGGYNHNFVYAAYGVVAAASVTVTATSSPSSTTLFTFTVTPNLVNFLYEIPAFAFPANDTSWSVTITWTGGIPIQEGLNESVRSLEVDAYAVPTTPSGSYTLNLDSTNRRGGGAWGNRSCGDNRRLRSSPNTTYETMGLGNGASFGYGPIAGNVWIGGVLYGYSWPPVCQGRNTSSPMGAIYVAGVGGATISETLVGLRYAQLTFVYTKITADPSPTDTFSWTLKQDGTTISTGSATGSAIKTIPLTVVSTTLPADGVTTTFQLIVTGTGSSHQWTCEAIFAGSFRCDIPLPFTTVGPGNNAAPGGYLPSFLGAVSNVQPLTRLAGGVTSYAFSSRSNIAFIIASSAWYEVTKSGVSQQFIGEDEFGWQNLPTLTRGRINRPFYARNDSGTGTYVLASVSPPTPTAAASGGTTITSDAATLCGFASITLPAAGQYQINLCATTFTLCGMNVDVSLTDPAVLNPTDNHKWEPYYEVNTAVGTFKGIVSTPPGSPTSYDSYVVGASPTGAWAGQTNKIAVWDNYVGQWQFCTPVAGSYIKPTGAITTYYWFDGATWHTNGTDPQLSFVVTVTGAQTIYLLIQPFDYVHGISGGNTIVSWALV